MDKESIIKPFLFMDIEGLPPMITEGKCLEAMDTYSEQLRKEIEEKDEIINNLNDAISRNESEAKGLIKQLEEKDKQIKAMEITYSEIYNEWKSLKQKEPTAF